MSGELYPIKRRVKSPNLEVARAFSVLCRRAGDSYEKTAKEITELFSDFGVYTITGHHAKFIQVHSTDDEAFKAAHDTTDNDSAVIEKWIPAFEAFAGWDRESQQWMISGGVK